MPRAASPRGKRTAAAEKPDERSAAEIGAANRRKGMEAERLAKEAEERRREERKSVVEQHKINLGGYDDDDDMGGDSADDMGEESGEEYEESEEEEEASEDLAIAPTELVRHFIDSMEANARGRKGSQLDATCAIAPLLGVISSDHEPPLTLRAAKCLCRLIRNNVGNRLAAHEGGGVGIFVTLLSKEGGGGGGGDEEAEQMARELTALSAEALCHLCGDTAEAATRVRLGGAVPVFVDGPLKNCATEPEAATWAAGALACIAASNNDGRSAMANHGKCLPALVNQIDFAVPWVAGIDSATRTSKPTPLHRKAARRAAQALASMFGSPEGADAVADVVCVTASKSPRIGHAIRKAHKPLLILLQDLARERLHAAQMSHSEDAMKTVLDLSRGVNLPKNETGAARHHFLAARRRKEDKKLHPWRYEEHPDFVQQRTPSAVAANILGHNAPTYTTTFGGAAPGLVVGSPRWNPPKMSPASEAGRRFMSASTGSMPMSPGQAGGMKGGSERGGGGGSERGGASPGQQRPPSEAGSHHSGTQRGLQSPDKKGMGEGGDVSYRMRSRSPGGARAGGGGGGNGGSQNGDSPVGRRGPGSQHGGNPSEDGNQGGEKKKSGSRDGNVAGAVAAAEDHMDKQLGSLRGVLVNAIGAVQREHEAVVGGLRADNRRLQAALAKSRAREAQYEEKLSRAVATMSGLSDFRKDLS